MEPTNALQHLAPALTKISRNKHRDLDKLAQGAKGAPADRFPSRAPQLWTLQEGPQPDAPSKNLLFGKTCLPCTPARNLYPEGQTSRACLLEALRVICIRGALERVLCITHSFSQPNGSCNIFCKHGPQLPEGIDIRQT